VDWFPWGEEAFEMARKLGRPVFLSIGYTTCHWCHVMEEESFEDEEIARYLNTHYVPVKLDREERPDVDSVYMSAVNVLTGRGGWPMSVWLTPDREPFMAGTYFPPRDGVRGSKRGFLSLIQEYSNSYMQDPDGIVAKAKDLARRLQSRLRGPGHAAGVGQEALHRAASSYQRIFDKDYGGFGRGNKFPRPSNLEFLLRYFRRTGDQGVEDIVVRTLDAMALGGLYDHVDDGFHRYTTERRFRIPHFEKMLYDNAQLVPVYLAAYQVFKYPRFKQVAKRTLDYVLRDLQAPEGGFFSATDADSEGEEGVFAVWTPGQVDRAVGEELSPFMKAHFNVTPRGNFEHRTTVLYTTETPEETGAKMGLSPEESLRRFKEGKEAMYGVRQKREQPILDDKVLTAWNGLMISALAHGSMVIGEERYGKAGERCARFLRDTMFVNQELKRRFHSGEVRFDAVLDDYAYLIQGLLDLHEWNGQDEWLEWALELQGIQDREFSSAGGGYFRAGKGVTELIARELPDYDGARPSGNSVSAMNLQRLYGLTSEVRFKKRAEGVFTALGRGLSRGTTAQPKLLAALDYWTDRSLQVVMAGDKEDLGRTFGSVLRDFWMPNRVLAYQLTGEPVPETGLKAGKVPLKGKPTVYVCEEGVCQRPVHTASALTRQLKSLESPLTIEGSGVERKRGKR